MIDTALINVDYAGIDDSSDARGAVALQVQLDRIQLVLPVDEIHAAVARRSTHVTEAEIGVKVFAIGVIETVEILEDQYLEDSPEGQVAE